MNFVTFDCETHRIAPRQTLGDDVALSPYKTPRIVCGSVWEAGSASLLNPSQLNAWLRRVLSDETLHIVCHHAPFDLDVVLEHDPALWPLIRSAFNAGRIHDTKILDVLLLLAAGHYDTPIPSEGWALPDVRVRGLDRLAFQYLGREVSKSDVDAQGDVIRLSFSKWDGRVEEMTADYRHYALLDAQLTAEVWAKMLSIAPEDLLGEPLRTRADFAVYALDKVGLRIDQAEADRLFHLFSADMRPLEERLVAASLGEWLPIAKSGARVRFDGPAAASPWTLQPGGHIRRVKAFKHHHVVETAQPHFHLAQQSVRNELERLAQDLNLAARYTPTGLLSIVADDWKDQIPAGRDDLQGWLQYERLKKILNTYLKLYRQTPQVFPRWRSFGARSGRMSCAAPNVQNVSKRKHGIRSLFIPHEGSVFLKADYSTQEMLTLAQSMLDLGIRGPLFDAIRRGADLHCTTAGMLLGRDPAEISKSERQSAKALNFGIPGGLGAAKLADYARSTYGVLWTKEEAQEMKKRFLTVYPDIAEFLERHKTDFGSNLMRATQRGLAWWKETLGVEGGVWALRTAMRKSEDRWIRSAYYGAERSLSVRLRTGRIRKGCTFTEGANTMFQGLAADVTLEAAWRCYAADLDVVLIVHDEIVIEAPPDPELAEAHAATLERCMLDAFTAVCPDVGPFASVEVSGPLSCWGKATDAEGKELQAVFVETGR